MERNLQPWVVQSQCELRTTCTCSSAVPSVFDVWLDMATPIPSASIIHADIASPETTRAIAAYERASTASWAESIGILVIVATATS